MKKMFRELFVGNRIDNTTAVTTFLVRERERDGRLETCFKVHSPSFRGAFRENLESKRERKIPIDMRMFNSQFYGNYSNLFVVLFVLNFFARVTTITVFTNALSEAARGR